MREFIFDVDTERLYYISSNVNEIMAEYCLKIVWLLNHAVDHRKSGDVYDTVRKPYFTMTREDIKLLIM